MGTLLLVFGGVTCFFGGKFFPWVLAVIIGSVVFMLTTLFASLIGALNAFQGGSSATGGMIALAVFSFIICLGLAIFAAWFFKKVRRVGFMALGGVAGFFVGFLLYTLLFIQFAKYVAIYLILTIGCAILGAILAWKFDKTVIVYATGAVGGYALVRGISIFAGGFPNEIELYTQIMSGQMPDMSNAFYGYLAGIVVISIVGIFTQRKLGYHQHHHDDAFHKLT